MRHRLTFFGASTERNEVKAVTLRKLHLFERSESAVFSHWFYAEKVVGSHRPRSRSESFFAYFFCGVKKYGSYEIQFHLKKYSN